MKQGNTAAIAAIFLALCLLTAAGVMIIKSAVPALLEPMAKITDLTKDRSGSPAIRPPAVAGSFYPADPRELNRELTRLLQEATAANAPAPKAPRILIVPHAGITYSGPTAAAGFRQIEGKNYTKIILLGASHHQLFSHAALDAERVWQTPLGPVSPDRSLAQALLDRDQGIVDNPSPHNPEHDLEVEVIFLQKVLSDFQIVPILVSQPTDEVIENLAQKIATHLDEQTLLVVSTDLSHYPSWETANHIDAQTIAAITSGQRKRLEETAAELENRGQPNLDTAACGFQALRVALRVAEILKIGNFVKIKYENSGDVSGEKNRVVGYAAIVGYGANLLAPAGGSAEAPLDSAAQQEALKLARQTLQNYLTQGQITSYYPQNPSLNRPLGNFTTLRKNGQLRGCIGEFEPDKPLYQVIQSTAVAAAVEDPRFPPVTARELSEITIELSVMTPKKKIDDWRKIELGKHGVVARKGSRAGTFLPQVAEETGWGLEQFLGQLCSQKAGLPADCYKDPTVNLYTFEAQVFGEV